MSNLSPSTVNTDRYAKCIEVSKRIRWDIDRDVIRGRSFDFGKKFLPDGLSKVNFSDKSRGGLAKVRLNQVNPTP